jgi:hypothetical protein
MQVEEASRSQVLTALRNAATATGSDFHYLLGTAMRESSLKPDAQSATSSAAGLFQFVDQTWLGLVKDHGAQHGLGDFANAITKDSSGRYHAEASAKQSILALRKDPGTAALMAGEYAKTTQGQMRNALGRDVCGGELYAAHFLGPDAACKLIKLAGSDPGASAAAQFPQAASANKSVFFNADGSAKSVRDVYSWAMRQPGATDAIRTAPVQAATLPDLNNARLTVATAQDSEVQMLLASVMNWQPGGHGMFGNLFGMDGKPQASALSFSPGLLGLLSDAKDSTSS